MKNKDTFEYLRGIRKAQRTFAIQGFNEKATVVILEKDKYTAFRDEVRMKGFYFDEEQPYYLGMKIVGQC